MNEKILVDKRLFAKEVWSRALQICWIQADIKQIIQEVATPGSELYEVIEEVVEHKLGGSQKIKTTGMHSLPDEEDDRLVLLHKLEEFGIVVEFYPEDSDHRINLITLKVPEKDEPITVLQLQMEEGK